MGPLPVQMLVGAVEPGFGPVRKGSCFGQVALRSGPNVDSQNSRA
jgi:hypothetical protein